jgi:tRNA(Arg) A34 adenosine deaminase TadA
MTLPSLEISLPGWVGEELPPEGNALESVEARMALAVRLARENVARGTGGPFGAVVFDDAGRVIAPGINQVVTGGSSILHAEIVALALAQRRLLSW